MSVWCVDRTPCGDKPVSRFKGAPLANVAAQSCVENLRSASLPGGQVSRRLAAVRFVADMRHWARSSGFGGLEACEPMARVVQNVWAQRADHLRRVRQLNLRQNN